MSLIDLKVKHGRTLEEAKVLLDQAVTDVKSRFGIMLPRVEWSSQKDQVVMGGPGVKLDLRVDGDNVHVQGDIPMLGGLLGPASKIKTMIEQAFQKRLK